MVEIKIIDTGGATLDRYTIIIGKSVYTMSQHPSHPQGFNQYAGEADGLDSFEGEGSASIVVNDEVLKAILRRME